MHWFVEREPCFVKMFVSSDRMTTEIARTPSQLFGVIAMMAISLNDEVTLDLEQFAARVGLESLSELDAVSLKTGDDPKGFPKAELFRTLTPLDCNSGLRGAFVPHHRCAAGGAGVSYRPP